MDTQNQGTGNSRHKTVELGCAAEYMFPNFAHTIGRITGYLRFVPKCSFVETTCVQSQIFNSLAIRSTMGCESTWSL